MKRLRKPAILCLKRARDLQSQPRLWTINLNRGWEGEKKKKRDIERYTTSSKILLCLSINLELTKGGSEMFHSKSNLQVTAISKLLEGFRHINTICYSQRLVTDAWWDKEPDGLILKHSSKVTSRLSAKSEDKTSDYTLLMFGEDKKHFTIFKSNYTCVRLSTLNRRCLRAMRTSIITNVSFFLVGEKTKHQY